MQCVGVCVCGDGGGYFDGPFYSHVFSEVSCNKADTSAGTFESARVRMQKRFVVSVSE